MSLERFRSPWWQPGGHVQTIWSALCARSRLRGQQARPWRRERWETGDADFIDVDFSSHAVAADAPTLALFHGLEGSSASHYARAMAEVCAQRGWQLAVPHFRGAAVSPIACCAPITQAMRPRWTGYCAGCSHKQVVNCWPWAFHWGMRWRVGRGCSSRLHSRW